MQPETPQTGSEYRPRIYCAVSTIGRWGPLYRLLQNIENAQGDAEVKVAICNQSTTEPPSSFIRHINSLSTTVQITTSSLHGLSAGRNAAANEFPGYGDYYWFPNDTTLPTEDFFHRLRRLAATIASAPHLIAGTIQDPTGPRSKIPSGIDAPYLLEPISKIRIWKAIEPVTLVRTDIFRSLGGFDEQLGTGAPSPWQSGEGTDLYLRIMEQVPAPTILWDNSLSVHGVGEFAGLSKQQKRSKIRSYARGNGYIYRKHNYPLALRLWPLVSSATVWLRKPKLYSISDAYLQLIGRLEGLYRKSSPQGTGQPWLR
ncbi:hypothetical protein HNR18_001646 [Pseudoclavibacter caeni]|nr:hypothetical protein [Pseudoclavibacter caeni]